MKPLAAALALLTMTASGGAFADTYPSVEYDFQPNVIDPEPEPGTGAACDGWLDQLSDWLAEQLGSGE